MPHNLKHFLFGFFLNHESPKIVTITSSILPEKKCDSWSGRMYKNKLLSRLFRIQWLESGGAILEPVLYANASSSSLSDAPVEWDPHSLRPLLNPYFFLVAEVVVGQLFWRTNDYFVVSLYGWRPAAVWPRLRPGISAHANVNSLLWRFLFLATIRMQRLPRD